mgnify:CR=1 FL=1
MATLALLGALWMLASPASAQASGWMLALDAGGGLDNGGLAATSSGEATSVSLRAGYQLPTPGLRIIPEVKAGLIRFGEDGLGNSAQEIRSMRAGLKVGLPGFISPAIYGHVGYGKLTGVEDTFPTIASGTTYDAGLALDLTLLPMINLGIHAGVNGMIDENRSETLRWYDAGAHIEVIF